LENNVQVEKEPKVAEPEAENDKADFKPNEVSRERIERMKRAFRPTWLHEQINSLGKASGPDGKAS
jgi:hypothetical protein